MNSQTSGSSTVTVNDTCYKGAVADTVKAFGDAITMGGSIVGMIITCICCSLFAYISLSSPSVLPKIAAACCVCSFASSIWKYFEAKNDIEKMKSSGQLQPC